MPARRHHYIPVFYLQQWAGPDGQICQFSRPCDRVVPNRLHPSRTGYQDDLYAMPGVPEHLRQWLEENFFRVADQQGNDALQVLLAGRTDLPPNLRSGWSRFIMSLLSRTPDRIAMLRASYAEELAKRNTALSDAYDEYYAAANPPRTAEQKAEDLRREQEIGAGQLIQSVMDLPGVGYHLNNMYWQIFTLANGRRTLLTSDRPVFISNGLQHGDSHIALPISPTRIFVAANETATFDKIAAGSASDVTQKSNLLVTQRAAKFVYGTDDYQVNFVNKYLR